MLGYTAFYPLPNAAFSAPGVLKEDFEQAPIGSGPFKMKGTWQHDAKIEVETLRRLPGHQAQGRRRRASRSTSSPTAAYADLLADNLDVHARTIPTESLATAAERPGRPVQARARRRTFQFLAFPTFDKDFSNADVRKAISMAIDRDEITKSIFKGSQTAGPLVRLAGRRRLPRGHLRRRPCKFNPTEAKELYRPPAARRRSSISYNADGGHKEWVDATCNQLKANLGVDVRRRGRAEVRRPADQGRAEEAESASFRMGWVMDYPSMENYLGPLYTHQRLVELLRLQQPGVRQRWSRRAPRRQDAGRRRSRSTRQAEDILAKDMPVIPLRFGQNNFGHSTKVKNVEMDLFSRVDLDQDRSQSTELTMVRAARRQPGADRPRGRPQLRTRRGDASSPGRTHVSDISGTKGCCPATFRTFRRDC